MIALGCFQDALSFDEELGDQLGVSTDYNNMGIAVRRLGDTDKALEYFEKALKIDKKLDNKRGLLRTYNNMVNASLQKGDHDKAQQYYDEYVSVYRELNERSLWQSGQYFHIVMERN